MSKQIEVLFLGSKLCAMELNVWLVGEGANKLNLKQRVKMTHSLSRVSLPQGKSFDLIIVDFPCFRLDMSAKDDLNQAHEKFPEAKVILFASGDEKYRQELFALAGQFQAQIEYAIGELAEKIRRFFFPEDFQEKEVAA